MIRTETVLDSWKTVRQDTAQTVEDFPAAELDFKPVGEVMTFREIARHILEAGHALTGLMLDGVENMATPQFRESLQKYIAQLPQTPDALSLAQALRQNIERRARNSPCSRRSSSRTSSRGLTDRWSRAWKWCNSPRSTS